MIQIEAIGEEKVKATTNELAKRLKVEYATANQLLKLLGDQAECIETRPNPNGRGRGSKVYSIPAVFRVDLRAA